MRRGLDRPSASTKPSTTATASDATVRARARSAPFQYGPEVSASQKRWVSKPPSRGYFTSPGGIRCFAASRFSVPFVFSVAIADLNCAPRSASDFR